ncbi:MAG: tetratricopeptide repeat protein [Bryobacteraceae bacterium]
MARRLPLLLHFISQYPKDESIGWVYAQLRKIHIEQNLLDKAIETGEKLLLLDADDVETIHENLKLAETLKNPALVKTWAARTEAVSLRLAASEKPADLKAAELWSTRVDLARQLLAYTDYLAYSEALQTPDLKRRLVLLDEFLAQRPKSQYRLQAETHVFYGHQQAGDTAKALAWAEKFVKRDPSNEDMLLLVAEHLFQKEQDPDRVMQYAGKVLDLAATKAKPEGLADADWNKRKTQLTGRANWLVGRISMDQGKFYQADRALRAALPTLKSSDSLTATALFFLGWANYKVGNFPDAIRFNQQCLDMRGPYHEMAAKNLSAIQAERAAR